VSQQHRKRRVYAPITTPTDLPVSDVAVTVQHVLDAPARYSTHEVRLIAPAMVVVIERDAPPRLEIAGVETRGDATALQSFLDSDELALDIRSAFYSHAQDDPVVHERREQYTERLDQGQNLSSLRSS